MFSKHHRGKPLGSQARQVVNNVRLYFAKKKEDQVGQGDEEARNTNVTKVTSLATGVSEWTVKMAKKKTSGEGGCESPKRTRPDRTQLEFDDFEKSALRMLVHTMHMNGDNVTLDTMTAAVQEKMNHIMSLKYLRMS